METAASFGNGVRAPASLGPASAVLLGHARRRALGPGAGPAGWRFVPAAGHTPCDRARGARCQKDGAGKRHRGNAREPASITRRAHNATLTMIILARRVRVAAARNAAVFAARREGLRCSGAYWWSETPLGGCGEGKALEGEQPRKDTRDHRAGKTPSLWWKLCHAGMEPPPMVKVNEDDARNARYSATVAEVAHRCPTDAQISEREDSGVQTATRGPLLRAARLNTCLAVQRQGARRNTRRNDFRRYNARRRHCVPHRATGREHGVPAASTSSLLQTKSL